MHCIWWAGKDSSRFFFSSRRRHTRLQGDWSSDVCSSDLAGSNQMRVTWRLAAWVISAAAFAAHIGYEHVRLRSSPATAALHASSAVAMGAFALAVAAMVHARAASGLQHSHALALVLWPGVTALPAFVVALAAAAGLALTRRTDD